MISFSLASSFAIVIAIMFCAVTLELLVRLIELLLVIRRKTALVLAYAFARRISTTGCDCVEWRVRRDTVAMHYCVACSRVFIYIVAIILGVCLLPLRIFFVEFVLIISRQPSLPTGWHSRDCHIHWLS